EVGLLRHRGFRITFARHRVRHTNRVVDVHLAAVGFDVELAGFAHCAVGAGFGAARKSCIWPLAHPGNPLPVFFYRLSAVRETFAESGPDTGISRPVRAAVVMRRTAFSVERASDFRSTPGSTSNGTPKVTTTSIAPSRRTRFKCDKRFMSPYQAATGRCWRPMGIPCSRV